MISRLISAALVALLAGCGKAPSPSSFASESPAVLPSDDYGVGEDHTVAIGPPPSASPTPPIPFAAALVRAEWAKAENRADCAPLAFTDDGGAGGKARRANFSGGWAVAFDLPDRRSAYGVAGPGLIEADSRPFAERRGELAARWPYAWASNETGLLPPTAFAGFGIEGFGAYSDADPLGRKAKSLAYLIVPGQRCQYNVWTTLGRDHMERLLNGLTIIAAR